MKLLYDKEMLTLRDKLISPFDEGNVQNICYDLSTLSFSREKDKHDKNICLQQGDSVFVESNEIINLPNNVCAKIVLRNSRIRQGLTLDAPIYQPGHNSRVFYRVTNVAASEIYLDTVTGIAAIMFYQLDGDVNKPYDGSFQDEMKYNDMGLYSEVLSSQTKKLDKKVDDIKDMEKGIYTNVLSIMAIFVAIFSIINLNVSNAGSAMDLKRMMAMNLSVVGSILLLISAVNTFILDGKHKAISWILGAIAFAIAIAIML